jgi:hypothetical protein
MNFLVGVELFNWLTQLLTIRQSHIKMSEIFMVNIYKFSLEKINS